MERLLVAVTATSATQSCQLRDALGREPLALAPLPPQIEQVFFVAVAADDIHMPVLGLGCPVARRARVVSVVDEHLGGCPGCAVFGETHLVACAAPAIADAEHMLVEAEQKRDGEVGTIELVHGYSPEKSLIESGCIIQHI